MIDRFRCVIPGVLYRGSAPNIEDLKFLKKMGIKKIVSLDEEVSNEIDRSAKILGFQHIDLPIDLGNKGTIINVLSQDLGQVFLTNGPTYTHCFHGRDRTGFIIALLRVKYQGWDCQRALQEANSLDFGDGLDPSGKALFTRIIKENCPKCEVEKKNPATKEKDINNAEDIVSGAKDNLEYSNEAISGLSWAPYSDGSTRGFPYTGVQTRRDFDTDEQYPTRQDFDLDDSDFWKHIDNQVEMPNSGQYGDSGPVINGLGPSALNNAFI